MQFGRLHGIALAVLGLLLISVQIVFAFAGSTDINPAAHPASSAVTAQQSHHLSPLAGIIGAASLVTGLAIFATARRRDEPEPQHAVK